jgi:predicted  nucleic acid-binding Zn-ribbon protein
MSAYGALGSVFAKPKEDFANGSKSCVLKFFLSQGEDSRGTSEKMRPTKSLERCA